MKRFLTPLALLFFAAVLLIPGNVMAVEELRVKPMHKSPAAGSYQRVPGEVIVKFKSGVEAEEIATIYNEVGAKLKRSSSKPGKLAT